MVDLADMRFKWFLIGFLSSQEGWNGEYPFEINNSADSEKTIQEKLQAFMNLLKEGNKGAKKTGGAFQRMSQ